MIAPNLLQIIVVGAGLIGPRHALHVSNNPQTDLFAIIDPNPATADVAETFNTLYFPSIESCMKYCDENSIPYPDGAIVCTPNHTHVSVSAELASYGIHLLVEKPIGSTPEDAKALKHYCELKNVKVLVGHHRRFNPYILSTKKNLSKVGQIVAIQGSWMLSKPQEYFDVSPWRKSTSTGGGVLLINLVHDLDLLQYMFGRIQRIYAELLSQQRNHEADEGAALTIKFESGVTGTFICCDNVVSPFNFESGTGENPTIPKNQGVSGIYRIFGSKGTLSMPDMKLYHQEKDVTSSWTNPINETVIESDLEKLPFDSQLEHFIDLIRGNVKEPWCSIDDGISALLCIDAVMKSIESDMPVKVPDIKSVSADYSKLGVDQGVFN
ncbi:oxidoreductase, putative [Candida dubliniensis CD36]|uniref:Oxidoreductase, putative n=1 Tax=Candida dubliniensis (strain CD36 / ATCC MYA-646 / CBS 7987 / NCPF 3949 / NRRL Y-17841) TaxID=573826 RepID=B9WK06_CANDC|nr:oxidoreductase, putative [Candida dubliniensis CD36]CAX40657.1 oxidoreductase, putative [Candida dubliniensis CD36]